MKAKWKDEEIKKLFSLVENNNSQNKSMIQSFKDFGRLTNRNALSVRNFYYAFAKLLNDDLSLQKKLDIDISKHNVQKFVHFDIAGENEVIEKIENLKNQGFSTRSACLKLSNGNIKTMLRLQNKYRSLQDKYHKQKNGQEQIQKSKNGFLNSVQNNIQNNTTSASLSNKNNENDNQNKIEIINFPKNISNQNSKPNNLQKNKLSDNDIKSLFMGLVNLVKESVQNDSQQKAQKFLEQTEAQNRKNVVELEQKQFEIDKLKQTILVLQNKNKTLNKQLEEYRINYM